MIVDGYNAFRKLFALPGADIAIDGLPEWPAEMVNANGFDQGIAIVYVAETTSYFATFDIADADDAPFSDDYDWFCSVRTEDAAGKPLLFEPLPGYSGTLEMTLSTWASDAYPSPFARSVIPALFGSCFLYVRRRSDGAIQVLDLEKYVAVNLAIDD